MAPTVLFVCVQNAGRSLMAEALFNRFAGIRARARSAGSSPAAHPHPEVVEVLSEVGIDVSRAVPEGLTPAITQGVDVVVTMGCGDACPTVPEARVIEWDLPDPAGRPLDEVRSIRDDIDRRARALVDDLTAGAGARTV